MDTLTATAPSRSAAQKPPAGLPDLRALTSWLAPHLPDLGSSTALRAQRIDGGQSNPSWILHGERRSWVLRAKPAPVAQLAPSAHAIEREFRILQALRHTEVPVPRVRALCEDESVIGVAFYVMDFVEGRIFRDPTLPDLPPDARAPCVLEAARVLAALHRVDWRALGLQDFGRVDGYFSRLIRRWSQQALASTAPLAPAMHRLIDWLPQHIPAGADGAGATCITHGDFRLENLMFHPARPEVAAVLDWELATLGHPLGDLAYSVLAWHMPAGLLRGFGDQDLATLGLPLEADYIARYCDHAGLDPLAVRADWPFYLAFNLFRLSAILQGIGDRERAGTASSASARTIAAMASPVADWGWAIAQGRQPALSA